MKEFIVKKTPHKPFIRDIEEYMSKVDILEENEKNIRGSIDTLDSNMSSLHSRVDNAENSISELNNKLSNISVDMMTPIAYSELKSLRDDSKLTPGMFYRITDYVCTTSQENTRAMDHKFDIIVQALSTNTLSENASADYHISEQSTEVPVLMDSVITNKAIGSLVNIYYTEFTDSTGSGELQDDYRKGCHNEDIIVEYGYQENNDGETVPVLYKTDCTGVDPTRPDYNPEFAEADYEDVFYYVGTTEVEDIAYDRWRKIDGEHPWDSDSQIYIYTNVIVQDGSIELDSESLLIEVEDEPRLDCTKITSVYYEYVDFTEDGNYDLTLDEWFKFAAYDYLPNNEGNVVPVLYDWFEGIPKNDKFFYIGKATIDGASYDKWRKIDDGERGWDSEVKMFFYTNEIVEYATVKSYNYIFEPSIINGDGTIVEGAIESAYVEMIDAFAAYDGTLQKSREEFIAYDYLANDKGETVPVIYQMYDDEVDTEQPYYHIGRETIDGIEYDKWRKIELNNTDTFGWGSEGKYYCYTNVVTTVGIVIADFADANLSAWELKYCLDNDTDRFAWAVVESQAIINLNSSYSNGNPLTRQPEFDGSLDGYEDYEEYYYAWGTQGDVDDGDPVNFIYSKNSVIANGEEVWNNYDSEFQTAEIGALGGGKGVIYYMKDEWNNECPYDFKNIQFQRNIEWQEEHSDFITGLGLTVDDLEWFYTFSYINMENLTAEDLTLRQDLPSDEDHVKYGTHDNSMLPYTQDAISIPRTALNNNVMIYCPAADPCFYGCYGNNFKNNCYNNTFGNECVSNTLGDDCFANTFGNCCYSITFGNECYFNNFGEACDSITFGNNCGFNTFGHTCRSNTFGNYCFSITGGNYCYSNTFGNECNYMAFGDSCYSNTFGNECNFITFGDSCYSNTFESGCYNNTFGNYCIGNSFESSCHDNTFGDFWTSNRFGDFCGDNNFVDSEGTVISYVENIYFGANCCNIILINSEVANRDNYVRNITVSMGIRGTGNSPLELHVSRNAPPVVYEAAGTTHIILD